jgi:hypothetical protein
LNSLQARASKHPLLGGASECAGCAHERQDGHMHVCEPVARQDPAFPEPRKLAENSLSWCHDAHGHECMPTLPTRRCVLNHRRHGCLLCTFESAMRRLTKTTNINQPFTTATHRTQLRLLHTQIAAIAELPGQIKHEQDVARRCVAVGFFTAAECLMLAMCTAGRPTLCWNDN